MQNTNIERNLALRQPNQGKPLIQNSRRIRVELPSPITAQATNIKSEQLRPSLTENSATTSGEAREKITAGTTLATTLSIANQRKIVILRLKELQARIGLGRSAIYYLMDPNHPQYDCNFPRSIKISNHCVGWIEYEVDEYLRSRVSASRG